jgi:hypothetical protein
MHLFIVPLRLARRRAARRSEFACSATHRAETLTFSERFTRSNSGASLELHRKSIGCPFIVASGGECTASSGIFEFPAAAFFELMASASFTTEIIAAPTQVGTQETRRGGSRACGTERIEERVTSKRPKLRRRAKYSGAP